MTMMKKESFICSVCGKESEQDVLISSNEFGSMDLDTRPPEMMRSTMETWLQECPHCGYVNTEISRDGMSSILAPTIMYKSEYHEAFGLTNDLAKRFYRYSLIQVDFEKKVFALLQAAWCCDDDEDSEKAKTLRKKAAEILDKVIPKIEDRGSRANLQLMQLDILRRACEFEKAKQKCDEFTKPSEYDNIVRYQQHLVEQKDDTCHTVEEAHTYNEHSEENAN